MSSSDLDLSVPPSAEQIRKREFATVRRGYDADQVRDYLKQVADQIEGLEHSGHDAKTAVAAAETAASDATAALQAALDRARAAEHDAREAREAAQETAAAVVEQPSADPYGAFGERMAEMLRTAEFESASIKEAAEMESRRVEMEARAEADRITTDAQSRAEEIRSEAGVVMNKSQEEADRMLAGLHSKKASLMAELEHMRDRLLSMAESLEALAGPDPAEIAQGVPSTPLVTPTQSTRFFSESQLKELWQDEGLLPDDADLTEQIDETMAEAATEEASGPTIDDGTVAALQEAPEPVLNPESPFFVDETTPNDDDPGASGLYPR